MQYHYTICVRFLIEFCPAGWHPTRSTCMRVIESAVDMTYDDAKAKCSEVDPIAYPVEPHNEYLQGELKTIITNGSLTETDFWIGRCTL